MVDSVDEDFFNFPALAEVGMVSVDLQTHATRSCSMELYEKNREMA